MSLIKNPWRTLRFSSGKLKSWQRCQNGHYIAKFGNIKAKNQDLVSDVIHVLGVMGTFLIRKIFLLLLLPGME